MTLEYLESLPPLAEVVGYRSYQQILDSMVANLQAAQPDWTGAGDDSDIAYQTLRAAASETKTTETMMLVTLSALDLSAAQDVYLEYLGARRGIRKRDGEDQEQLRIRIAEGLGVEGAPVPGTTDGIKRLAYEADARVYDVQAIVRANGQTVDVYILAKGDSDGQETGMPYGTPTRELISKVQNYISGPDEQHLSDTYVVQQARIIPASISNLQITVPASYQIAEERIKEVVVDGLMKWGRKKPQFEIGQGGVWTIRMLGELNFLVPEIVNSQFAISPHNVAGVNGAAIVLTAVDFLPEAIIYV